LKVDDAEHFARLIAKALHADIDPDDRVSPAGANHRAGFYVVPRAEHTVALWQLYADAGRAIADEVERRLEERGSK
jgi:hypothetical protein